MSNVDDVRVSGDEEPAAVGALPTFRGLAARSALFGLGGVAQKVVGVLLIPVISRSLSTRDFGHLEVLSTLVTAITTIAVLGLDIVVTRRWVDIDAAARRRVFSSWFGLSLALGGSVALVATFGAPALSRIAFDTSDLSWGIRLVGLCALVNLLSVVGLTALRNEGRPGTYAMVAVTTVVTNGVLSGALAWRLESPEAVLLGLTIATSLGALLAIAATRPLVLHRPSAHETRRLLVLTAPLVPGLLLTSGGDLASRFVLLGQAGATEVGYYSIAIRFAAVGLLIHMGFQLAWQPRAYEIAHRPGGRRRLGEDAAAITVILSAVTVALACLSPELLRILAGPRYDAAIAAVGLGLLVPLATMLLTITSTPLAIANQLRRFGMATAAAAVASLVMTAVLAEAHGAAGAMAALTIGQLVGCLVALASTRGSSYTPEFGAWRWCALAALAAVVSVSVTSPSDTLPVLPRLLALVAFAGVAVAMEPALLRSGVARLLELRPSQRR